MTKNGFTLEQHLEQGGIMRDITANLTKLNILIAEHYTEKTGLDEIMVNARMAVNAVADALTARFYQEHPELERKAGYIYKGAPGDFPWNPQPPTE